MRATPEASSCSDVLVAYFGALRVGRLAAVHEADIRAISPGDCGRCCITHTLTGKSLPRPVRGSGPILGGATLTSKERGQCH
ncbi:MAG: hypothetical protein ABSA93_34240, partial [Streptosporangiaceae bacterium]